MMMMMLYFQLLDEMGRWIAAHGCQMGTAKIEFSVLLSWIQEALVKDGRPMAAILSGNILDAVGGRRKFVSLSRTRFFCG